MLTDYISAAILCTVIKLLLIPTYHSTDFEVHRNWLAITNSRNLKLWYYDNTSQWTLDYPPFFAYFEFVISFIAKNLHLDPKMLEISKQPYFSEQTLYFQRLTVVITDIVLLFAAYRLIHSINNGNDQKSESRRLFMFMLVAFNCGLYIVDHIHFQYNGILIGILIMCLEFSYKDNYVLLTLAFVSLIMMKHLFIYFAPILGLYVLSKYCVKFTKKSIQIQWFALFKCIIAAMLPLVGKFVIQAP